jgi:hypothetical protein
MDEMGHQEWSDAIDTICFVPRDIEDQLIFYPVSRTGKRITLIACIAADGSYVRPCLIIQRKTFDDELLVQGFTPEKVEIYSQSLSFVDIAFSMTGFETPSYRISLDDASDSATRDRHFSLQTTAPHIAGSSSMLSVNLIMLCQFGSLHIHQINCKC